MFEWVWCERLRESEGEGGEGSSDALVWEAADSGADAARDAVGPPSGDACARLLHVPKVRESRGYQGSLGDEGRPLGLAWCVPPGALVSRLKLLRPRPSHVQRLTCGHHISAFPHGA